MNEFGIVIGQFQPFNNTHLALIRFALSRVRNLIIVVTGDSQPRTIKTPWSTDERTKMIRSCLVPKEISHIKFVSVKDYLYNENLWITSIQSKINALTDNAQDVVLIGHKNSFDHYLNHFPQWGFIESGDLLNGGVTPAAIRGMYFTLDLLDLKKHIPEAVFDMLKHEMLCDDNITPRSEFVELKDEFNHIKKYKELWNAAPFPPTFVTVDAVVIKSGHVLVVRRRAYPGKGLLALPGGFIKQNESIIDSCLRELKEETVIKIPKDKLITAICDQRVFDHPDRSLRGRTITHAFCFNLGQGQLPKVKGEDDADKAFWMSLRDVFNSESKFFEDHFHIITHFVHKF